MLEYTEIWNDFQFRSPTYFDGHIEPYDFDLVKWQDHKPYEVTDFKTGEKKISTRSCFSIGTLKWDNKNCSFSFVTCGMRYFDYYVDGLEKFISDFAKKMEEKLMAEKVEE